MNQNFQFQQHGFLSSANFNNNQQSDEVNWAQLAQRWIYAHQQQQAYPPAIPTGTGEYPQPHQAQFPPRYPHPQNYPQQPMPMAQASIQPLFSSTGHRQPGYFPPPSIQQQTHFPPNQWESRPPFPPPPNMSYSQYPPRAMPVASLPLIQYPLPQSSGAKQEEEEYQAHYDPSLADDPAETDQSPHQQEIDPNAPPEGAMGHWMINNMWSTTPGYTNNYMPVIDMQMRKKLPSWILEGLEKAEKEKQKKLEKEEMEQQQKELQEKKQRKREEKGLGKFDSDSEDEEHEIKIKQNDEQTTRTSSPVRHFREFIGDHKEEDERTIEERRQEAVLLMRRLITTVLLNATNREFDRIAEEAIANAKSSKAQPKILAKSSALAMLSSFGDEDEEDDTSSNDGMNSPRGVCGQKTNASPVHNEERAVKDSHLVFKVPLAPPPKSSVSNQHGDTLVKKDEDKQRGERSDDQEQERQNLTRRKQSEKNTRKETDERKHDDDNLPAHYRSSNGKNKERDRDREKDRSRERDRERDRNRERDRDVPSRRDDRNKSGERVRNKDRRRYSKSRSRSPRNRRHTNRSNYRDGSRSPRR